MAATQAAEKQVSLKLLLNKERDKVLFAEAGKDFVDVLFSFLTLPLGTIVRLVGKESNMQPVRVGCLSSLYEGVKNLDEECLWTETCKEMLLQPRNSMEDYCRKLKLNIDDTVPIKYFICESYSRGSCGRRLLSCFKNQRCPCGNLMKIETTGNCGLKNGFVQETTSLIICDDLNVMPNVLGSSVVLLQNLGIEDMDAIVEQTIIVREKEVLDLLKCSLFSETPLTDIFLKKKVKKQFLNNFNPMNQSQFEIIRGKIHKGRKMVVKVMLRKSNGKVLLAQAEEDFADFIFSFLTFPLGGVLHMLQGCSSLSCVDNLFKSLASRSDRYFTSKGIKDNLANPQCAHQFKFNNQILPIGEASWLSLAPTGYDFVDPKSSNGQTSSARGFAKGPSIYMITDDLVVTPMSFISAFSYLNRSNVPLSDMEEWVISIGLKEALSILKASLISTSALTNGLKAIIKSIKKEN